MEVEIKKITCCNCGVLFWITNGFDSNLLKSKNTFYCPNGHGQSYTGETEKEKYEGLLKQKNESIEFYTKRISEEFNEKEKLRKSIIGYKGMLGRYKKKLKNAIGEKDEL